MYNTHIMEKQMQNRGEFPLNQMGSYIRTMRDRHHMNQDDFIDALKHAYGKGIAKSTLSGWESGQKNPPIEDNNFIEALATIFSVTTADVLKGSGYNLGPAYEELDEQRKRLLAAYDSGDLERLVRVALSKLDEETEAQAHRLGTHGDEDTGPADTTRVARR
jgi:transcriptional regulator with XRE-family HTH domain